MRLLAIPLSPKVRGKRLFIAIRLSEQKVLYSYLTKVVKLRQLSHWLTLANSLVMALLSISPLAGAADLLEIYHAAQSQDAVFAAARATQRAGEEKLPQGRSLLLPSVNLNANSTYNNNWIQYRGAFLIPMSALFPFPMVRCSSTATVMA